MADESDFCAEMRVKTQKTHDKSDKLVNLKLAVVLTDTKLWGHVLADFYYVFQAIENAIYEHQSHQHVGPLYFEELRRTEAFEKDLAFYLGPDWRGQVKPSEPAMKYCDRIGEIAQNDPSMLVAYAHSMYMALLAGGQIIKRIVKKTLGLSGNDGLNIFDFEDMNRTEVKKQFVSNINNMDLTRDQKDRIISEKIRVFSMNNAIASNVKPTAQSFQRLIKFILAIIVLIVLIIYLITRLF